MELQSKADNTAATRSDRQLLTETIRITSDDYSRKGLSMSGALYCPIQLASVSKNESGLRVPKISSQQISGRGDGV